MHFRYADAPSIFQKNMNYILSKRFKMTLVSFEPNVDKLRQLFSMLRSFNYKLQPNKFIMGYQWIEILGHMVDGDEIRFDPEKLNAILSDPIPTKKSELSFFHGLLSSISAI